MHCLERSNRSLLSRRDSFLQGANFSSQRGLIPDRAGGASEQRRDFGTSLRKPEDVVDEEQHILIFLVAKIFGNGEARQRHSQTSTGRFIHLAVYQSNFRIL